MIANNEDRYIRISLLLRNVMRGSRDAYEYLHKNDEFEFIHLIENITHYLNCINTEIVEASREEFVSCIQQMFDEERENGDE